MTTRLVGCVLAGVAGVSSGCPHTGAPPLAGSEVPPERAPVPRIQACDLDRPMSGCPPTQCGTNSPVLAGFAFGELNLDGCRNWFGTRLLPGSLRAGACGDRPLAIELIAGELVGVTPGTRTPACRGRALAGATFWIEGRAGKLGAPGTPIAQLPPATFVRRQLRIRITDEVELPDPPHAALPAYLIEQTAVALAIKDRASTDPSAWFEVGEPQPLAAETGALCSHADRWLAGWPQPGEPEEPAGPSVDQQAIAVAGELYGPRYDVFHAPNAARWFHLACAGSALAKSRLMGYDPLAATSSPGERAATLKMLTAHYCDASYTEPGVPLYMVGGNRAAPPEQGDPRIGPIEARWTAAGASCLSHARLWRAGVPVPSELGGLDEARLVSAIRERCGIPACTGARRHDEHWETFTVDHIAHQPVVRDGQRAP